MRLRISRLGDALERAGHRAKIPTARVFEGVISYLLPRDVEASVRAIAERSASGSRLLAADWPETAGGRGGT